MTLFRALALAIFALIPSSMPLLADQADGRSLGMAITAPQQGNSESAAMLAYGAGVTRAPITYAWGALEPEPGKYDDSNLALAALFFPAMGMTIDIAITPIAGNQLVMPGDLAGRDFDDPDVVRRYLDLIGHVLTVLADADVGVLLVGVEVDALLGDNADAWEDYASLVAAAASYAHTIRPGIEVGVQSTTYSRVVDPELWTGVDSATDIIATSYYPLDGLEVRDPALVASDFETLTSLYPNRIIRIVEAGFPSSKANGSTPELQAQFMHALFAAWDEHMTQIRSITLSVEHNYAPHRVEAICTFYGRNRDQCAAFIGSIGLRTWDGEGAPKPAWDALMQETAARGWQP
jgi:hypothetical protein